MTSTQPRIRPARFWWLECTLCGLDSYSGRVGYFASEIDLWQAMLATDQGWSRRDDGRVLCRVHSAVADCETNGHEVCRWVEHPIEPDLDWRYCIHCGALFQQRIATAPGKVAD